jgi:hypothetical protein
MALRPLPLAAGALSSPEMSPTTLPRSPEPRFRHALPASSSARPSARTGGGHAIEFTILSASQCEEPLRLAEQSALERKAASSAPHASHVPYRCLCRAGAAGAAGERSSAGRAYAFVTGWRNCIGTCNTGPVTSRLRAAIVASTSKVTDRRLLCTHLVSPGQVCDGQWSLGVAILSR